MRPRLVFLSTAALALLPITVVYAHERFIRHDLKFPLHEQYFGRHPGVLLGMRGELPHRQTSEAAVVPCDRRVGGNPLPA